MPIPIPIELPVTIDALPFITINLKIWQLNCSSLAVGEVELSSELQPDGRTLVLTGAVRQLQIACLGFWSVDGFWNEDGVINLSTQGARLEVALHVSTVTTASDDTSAWLEPGAPLRAEGCNAWLPLEIDRATVSSEG